MLSGLTRLLPADRDRNRSGRPQSGRAGSEGFPAVPWVAREGRHPCPSFDAARSTVPLFPSPGHNREGAQSPDLLARYAVGGAIVCHGSHFVSDVGVSAKPPRSGRA
jgi:hypothetical protein